MLCLLIWFIVHKQLMYLTQLNKIDIIIIQKSEFNRLTREGLTELCSASKRKRKTRDLHNVMRKCWQSDSVTLCYSHRHLLLLPSSSSQAQLFWWDLWA